MASEVVEGFVAERIVSRLDVSGRFQEAEDDVSDGCSDVDPASAVIGLDLTHESRASPGKRRRCCLHVLYAEDDHADAIRVLLQELAFWTISRSRLPVADAAAASLELASASPTAWYMRELLEAQRAHQLAIPLELVYEEVDMIDALNAE